MLTPGMVKGSRPSERNEPMRLLVLIGAACVLLSLGSAMITTTECAGIAVLGSGLALDKAEAAIGRGNGGAGGGADASQAGDKAATLLQGWVAPMIFILAAIGIGVAAFQRNAGMAVVVVVLALVIGAFTLVPDQVEAWFKDIYRYVL